MPLTVTEVVRRSGVTHSGFVWMIIEGERAAMKDSEFEVGGKECAMPEGRDNTPPAEQVRITNGVVLV